MVTLTRKSRRLLLAAANAALVAAIAACVGLLALRPLDPGPASAVGPTPPTGSPGGRRALRPLDEYLAACQRPLRRPLFDPKTTPIAQSRPRPTFNAVLAATALESGFTYAMFRMPNGQTTLVGLGESIAGAEVTEITSDSATVRLEGELITVKVARPEGHR